MANTISLTLSFRKGASSIEAYHVSHAIQEYIDENGLSQEIFDNCDEFGDRARFYAGAPGCGVLEVEGVDETFQLDDLKTTSLPLLYNDLCDEFTDTDDYDEMIESAGGDEDKALETYIERVNHRATEAMDDDTRELYNEKYEEECGTLPMYRFLDELEHLNEDECEKYVYWLTNGESYKFEFNIGIEDGEEFDIDKLKIVAFDDWCDDDYTVFLDAIDLWDYSIFPEWIMYDGRFIHCEYAECTGFNCNESKVVLTDEEMCLVDD